METLNGREYKKCGRETGVDFHKFLKRGGNRGTVITLGNWTCVHTQTFKKDWRINEKQNNIRGCHLGLPRNIKSLSCVRGYGRSDRERMR